MLSRRGVTLFELLVTLVVGGAIAAAVARSRATTRGAGEGALAAAEARRQLQSALAGIEASVRSLDADGDDLLALADTALELRVSLGASIVCAASPPFVLPAWVALLAPDDVRAPGSAQATWHDAPAPGDALLLLARATVDGDTTPRWRWRTLRVTDVPSAARLDCAGRTGAAALRVPVDLPVPDESGAAGTPVRLLRRARWSAYRSGGRWFLGWRDASADGTLDVVQPVTGPHDVRDAAGGAWRSGIRFARDSGRLALRVASTVDASRIDSGVVLVTPRNRLP